MIPTIKKDEPKFPHYFIDVSQYKLIDVYDIAALYEIKSHRIGQVLKRILAAGKRGSKDARQDYIEAINLLEGELERMDIADNKEI